MTGRPERLRQARPAPVCPHCGGTVAAEYSARRATSWGLAVGNLVVASVFVCVGLIALSAVWLCLAGAAAALNVLMGVLN